MDERLRFIRDCLEQEEAMSRLCEAYGISRKTGYKWLSRYRDHGAAGLEDRPRSPLRHGRATAPLIVDHLLAVKERHPSWGPKKVVAYLRRQDGETVWPSASTAGEILKRHGLVQTRGRARWRGFGTGPFREVVRANSVWSADHKGWFRMKDGQRCEPLTVMDNKSRYLLKLTACGSTGDEEAWPVFERAFADYGLPDRLRSDNGPPFASVGVSGLTPLSVRFLKLGIELERIVPGKPQQNGAHERIHLTMLPLAQAPAVDRAAQQSAFDDFQRSYNEERPHEALGMDTPASRYRPSDRPMPKTLPEPDYPVQAAVRRVRPNGAIKWQGREIYVSASLAGEPVAVEENESGEWTLRFFTHPIGVIDTKHDRLIRSRASAAADEKPGRL
jgi:transposase InsO family protein